MAVDSLDVGARVRSRLLGQAGADLDTLSPPQRRLRVRDEVMAVLKEARMILPSSVVTQVVNQVSDEVVGLGPIERLLKDPEVSEGFVTNRGSGARAPRQAGRATAIPRAGPKRCDSARTTPLPARPGAC